MIDGLVSAALKNIMKGQIRALIWFPVDFKLLCVHSELVA